MAEDIKGEDIKPTPKTTQRPGYNQETGEFVV